MLRMFQVILLVLLATLNTGHAFDPVLPTVVVQQASYTVMSGENVTLECTVTSSNSPLTSVTWKRIIGEIRPPINVNNKKKYSGSTTEVPSLTILNSAKSDEGSYVCCASNQYGEGTSKATELSVTGICEKYSDGKLFRQEPCKICRCNRHEHKPVCSPIYCEPMGKCKTSVTPHEKCCPVCLSLPNYKTRAKYLYKSCHPYVANQIEDKYNTKATTKLTYGECHPISHACFFHGKVMQDMDRIQLDPCVTCKCTLGKIQCDVTQCNPVQVNNDNEYTDLQTCKNPTFCHSQCCARCENGLDEICAKRNGICVKRHNLFYFGEDLGKCCNGKCIKLPPLHLH